MQSGQLAFTGCHHRLCTECSPYLLGLDIQNAQVSPFSPGRHHPELFSDTGAVGDRERDAVPVLYVVRPMHIDRRSRADQSCAYC